LSDPFHEGQAVGSRFSPDAVQIHYQALWEDAETPAKLLASLAAMADSAVGELFSLLVALRTGSFCDQSPKYGDDPGTFKLAQTLGLSKAATSIDESFLQGYRKFHLLAVARSCGLDDPNLDRLTMPQI